MKIVFPEGSGLFQHVLCNTAGMVQEGLELQNNEFVVLTWPPTLNPFEHLWNVLEKQV